VHPVLVFLLVLLGVAALAGWVGAVVCMLRALAYRQPGRSALGVASLGMFRASNFTARGNAQRASMNRFMVLFLVAVSGMVAIGLVGGLLQ
jgi:hypothetical protein